MTTRSTPSACTASAASSARSSPACSRSSSTAAPPACSKATSRRSSTRCIGVGIVIVYDAIVSLIILKIVDIFIGLRVTEEVEREGLDLALHGETVHS